MRLGDLDEALRMIKDSKSDNPFVSNVTTRVWKIAHESAISCVEDTPTIDAVPVVRCKDCKHGEVDDPECFPGQYYCHEGHMWNKGCHFCADGERKDGDGNG